MSHYGWERGEIKLPAGAMNTVRKIVLDVHNELAVQAFDCANVVLKQLLAAGKGKRNFDYQREMRRVLYSGGSHAGSQAELNDIEDLLFPRRMVEEDGRKVYTQVKKPVKPKKKNIGVLGPRAKVVVFEDASIIFGDDGRTVIWEVSENNRACKRARAHPIGKAFFRALGRITWTRGSGGQIVGNDEYNQDSNDLGGGGNYLVESFGPEPARRGTRRR